MTFGVPVTLIDMRAALRQRVQLDGNDPRAADAVLNRFINAAMHRFQVANPNGWPWDFAEVPFTATVGVETIQTGASNLTKVRYVILQDPAGLWEYPLERVSRYEQLDRYPRDSETGAPRTFCLLASDGVGPSLISIGIHLRPKPDLAYGIVVGACFPRDDLAADADPDPAVNDYMIGDWIDTVLEYAAFLVYRSNDDFAEAAIGSKATFDAAVLQLRRTARLTLGAGVGMRPVADDRNLQ